jgi:hypothetical protein
MQEGHRKNVPRERTRELQRQHAHTDPLAGTVLPLRSLSNEATFGRLPEDQLLLPLIQDPDRGAI